MSHFLDVALLKRNKDLGFLYLGQFISFIGTMISYVVLPYQIYQLTQSSLMVGMLSFAELIPILFTALLGGVFADRYNRRALLIISELLLGIGSCLLAWNAMRAEASVAMIFILAMMMSAIQGLHRPALESMTQQIVDPHDYKKVGALTSFKYSFCMIVGPAIAGIIIANHGIVITYLIDFSTFIVSLLCLMAMKTTPKPEVLEHESVLTSLKQGIYFALQKQVLLGSYMVDFISMIFAMPNALFPAIAHNFGGAKTLGLLYAAPAVGALIISFVSGWTAKIKHDGRAIALAAGFWGLSMLGFGLSTSLTWALFYLMLAGIFDTISGIFRVTLWNNIIPQKFRGRLAGIEMISYLSGPKLGDARAGIVASFFGMTTALVTGGLFCMIGVTITCLSMRQFWHYQSHEDEA